MKRFKLSFRVFTATRGYSEPDGVYRSLFGYVWWFWIPRIHTQSPDSMNPIVIRLIWLFFAINLDIWTKESFKFWPGSKPKKKA